MTSVSVLGSASASTFQPSVEVLVSSVSVVVGPFMGDPVVVRSVSVSSSSFQNPTSGVSSETVSEPTSLSRSVGGPRVGDDGRSDVPSESVRGRVGVQELVVLAIRLEGTYPTLVPSTILTSNL